MLDSKADRLVTSILLIGFACCSLAILSIVYLREQVINSLVKSEAANELIIASQVASTLKNDLLVVQEKLNIIVRFPEVKNGGNECNNRLSSILEGLHKKIGNLTRVDENLKVVCSAQRSVLGQSREDVRSIESVLAESKISLSHYKKIDNKNAVLLHVPVIDSSGKTIGALGATIYLDELRASHLDDISLPKGSEISIYDGETLLYHPQTELIGKTSASEEFKVAQGADFSKIVSLASKDNKGTATYSKDGQKWIAAWVTSQIFPELAWTVVISVPEEEIMKQVGQTYTFVKLNPFLLTILSIIIISLLGVTASLYSIRHEHVYRSRKTV